jgi:peptide/nickel transport system permease protein
MVATFAEVLAADLPLFLRMDGHTWVLPAVTRPVALRSRSNESLAAELAPGDLAIYPLVRFGPNAPTIVGPLSPPSLSTGHPLGTDVVGRDVFARAVYGTRTTVTLALACALAFIALGTFFGAVGGFFGGWIDSLLTRLIETLTAFPPLVLVLAVQAILPRPTLMTMLVAIGLIRWPEIARVVRAQILTVVAQEYVLAARALGASPLRVLVRHVAPNVKGPVLVAVTFGLASVVLVEASLSFLHVGVPADTASWGEMLSEVRGRGGALWLLVAPGVLLFACLASLNAVAEALRDVLDPRPGL